MSQWIDLGNVITVLIAIGCWELLNWLKHLPMTCRKRIKSIPAVDYPRPCESAHPHCVSLHMAWLQQLCKGGFITEGQLADIRKEYAQQQRDLKR